jgi:hypothetical protein
MEIFAMRHGPEPGRSRLRMLFQDNRCKISSYFPSDARGDGFSIKMYD